MNERERERIPASGMIKLSGLLTIAYKRYDCSKSNRSTLEIFHLISFTVQRSAAYSSNQYPSAWSKTLKPFFIPNNSQYPSWLSTEQEARVRQYTWWISQEDRYILLSSSQQYTRRISPGSANTG
ncbi:hypothetical protein KQX54_021407 [Cotesia glomerata]|uniref:Uncharacterized protein n=1 Tax=Cotesia glomerata TaxID=32391 RepID=A0AAV7J998_COTGL|nr:hypothetical protein KQX54_021407 [Cotesia glomerata]